MSRKNSQWIIVSLVATVMVAGNARAGDWPTYKSDPQRSGVTAEELEFPLATKWIYAPGVPPMPAWAEPGKELHRMDFDYAFQPIAAGGLVFFASSADDTVRALNAKTGRPVWRFTTSGPIRFAPAVDQGKLYVVSDDGWLYCLDAESGKTLWQFHGAPGNDQIIGNGRMISRWPCRSDAVVVDGVVYFTAGMWSTEGVYVYALDAETGKELWCNDSSGNIYIDLPHPSATGFCGVAPQGYLVVSKDTLLVPTGRCVPAAFDRHTGKLLYYKPAMGTYDGGAWTTAAGNLFFNPKNRFQNPSQAFIGEADPVAGDGMIAYSLDSGEREFVLKARYRVLVAGDTLYAVGQGVVEKLDLNAHRRKKPVRQVVKWTTPHTPRVYCLALAGRTLLAGNRGSITAFDTTNGKPVWSVKVDGQVRGLAVADKRLIAATHEGTILCFQPGKQGEVSPKRINEKTTVPAKPGPEGSIYPVEEIVGRSGKSKGYAMVIGEPDSRLAERLALATKLHVVNVLEGTSRVAGERDRLLASGLCGWRVFVDGVDDLANLPYVPYFADLVVVSGKAKNTSPRECYRVLRPCGGTLCFVGFDDAQRREFVRSAGVGQGEISADGRMIVRDRLPGAGEWRYAWADGGRTGIGKESRVRLPLDVLWFGGPGPDRLMDRHLMTSPPLSVNGRVFMTGQNHVIAFDAYNGRELWSLRIEGVGRKYAQYYSSNFVADDDTVYVAVKDRCYRLDQVTGKIVFDYKIPQAVVQGTPPPVVPEYLDVEWPETWRVMGPFPKGKPPISAGTLKTMPDRITVNGKEYPARPLNAVDRVIDFTSLYNGFGLKPPGPGKKLKMHPRRAAKFDLSRAGRIAYAFATIKCPKDGKLLVGAGADWWMQWYLDGRPIFDTLKGGNRPSYHKLFSRETCAPTDYLFDVDVTAGEHVLAVMVKSGSRGWALASASMGKHAREVATLPADDPNLPDLKNLVWGYLSAADDLVLGSYNVPIADGQSEESQLIWRSESKAVFALDKKDGELRWVYRPRHDRTVSNIEIAFGDGKLFLLDATSKADSARAKRRGEKIDVNLELVALRLADGTELWRQGDVPVLPDRSFLSRLKSNPSHLFMGLPNWGHLLYSDGVVLLAVNAAYDAATGKKLWQKSVRPQKLPLIHDKWIIAQPHAYELRTGRQRMTSDPLTGSEVPWRFAKTYGCGPTNGCRNLLFFRSGADGFFDLLAEGTTNFGSIRPSCARSLLAAHGLMIHPEGYSGCCCAYSFQTSLALVPASGPNDTWYVFPQLASTGDIQRIGLNLGAPGDRKDQSGFAWLGFPRPIMAGGRPAPVTILMEDSTRYNHPRKTASIKNTDRPWLYSSGVRGRGEIAVGLKLEPNLIIPACDAAPTIDGKLDDACWKNAKAVPFENTPFTLLGTNVDLRICRDADNLYFGYHRKPIANARSDTDEATLAASDVLEMYITDRKKKGGIRFSLTRGGEAFARFGTVDRYRKVDPKWQGRWQWAVGSGQWAVDSGQWTAEVAVPIKTLTESGIDTGKLRLNCMSQNLTKSGLEAIFLVDPAYGRDFRRCVRFRTVAAPPRKHLKKRSFTVRLHFAEIEDTEVGRRVFDVVIQGATVAKDFDILKEAGGKNVALIKEFGQIRASGQIVIELVPRANGQPSTMPPAISAVEVLEEK